MFSCNMARCEKKIACREKPVLVTTKIRTVAYVEKDDRGDDVLVSRGHEIVEQRRVCVECAKLFGPPEVVDHRLVDITRRRISKKVEEDEIQDDLG